MASTDPGRAPSPYRSHTDTLLAAPALPPRASSGTVIGLPPVTVAADSVAASAAAPGPAAFIVEPGLIVGSYRVVHIVAERATDLIVAAEHKRLGRPATLRILKPELAASREAADRFMRDARMCAELTHPNLAEIHDSLRLAGNRVFQVVEALGEVTVEKIAASAGPLRAVRLALQFADLLEAAHSKGLAYRALREGSLFVLPRSSGDLLKTCDLQAAVPPGPDPNVLPRGPAEPAAVADDIVAVGALCAGLVAGEIGGTRIVLPADLPDTLVSFILWCLAPDVAQRPKTMAEVRRELSTCEATLAGRRATPLAVSAAPLETSLPVGIRTTTLETESVSPPGPPWLKWAGLVLGLLLLAAVAGLLGATRAKQTQLPAPLRAQAGSSATGADPAGNAATATGAPGAAEVNAARPGASASAPPAAGRVGAEPGAASPGPSIDRPAAGEPAGASVQARPTSPARRIEPALRPHRSRPAATGVGPPARPTRPAAGAATETLNPF